MSGNFYDNPVEVTYNFAAADIATAGTLASLRGPQGKGGRVRHLGYRVSTGVTVATSLVSVGSTGAAVSIPVSSVNAVGVASRSNLAAAVDIATDAQVDVTSDGGSTAGAADIVLTIGWF